MCAYVLLCELCVCAYTPVHLQSEPAHGQAAQVLGGTPAVCGLSQLPGPVTRGRSRWLGQKQEAGARSQNCLWGWPAGRKEEVPGIGLGSVGPCGWQCSCPGGLAARGAPSRECQEQGVRGYDSLGASHFWRTGPGSHVQVPCAQRIRDPPFHPCVSGHPGTLLQGGCGGGDRCSPLCKSCEAPSSSLRLGWRSGPPPSCQTFRLCTVPGRL